MFWGFAGTVRWSHGVDGTAQIDCDITLGKSCDNQSARRERLLATRADAVAATDGGLDNDATDSSGADAAARMTAARMTAAQMARHAPAAWRRRRAAADEAVAFVVTNDAGEDNGGTEMTPRGLRQPAEAQWEPDQRDRR